MPRPAGARPSNDADADDPELEQEADEAAQKAEISAIEAIKKEERRIEAERVALDARKAALAGGRRVKQEETSQLRPARTWKGEVIDLSLSD